MSEKGKIRFISEEKTKELQKDGLYAIMIMLN